MNLVNEIKENLIDSKLDLFKHSPIKAFVISMINDHTSTVATRKVLQSIATTNSIIDPYILNATTPMDLNKHLRIINLNLSDWTWPKSPAESRIDIKTGLRISGYGAADYTKVVSCLISHLRLWKICIELQEPIMVLEHDAVFTRKFSYEHVRNKYRGILGLNDPRGATRKSQLFHELTRDKGEGVHDAPWIDDQSVPQGIAGNSAYIIKPHMAGKLIKQTFEIGMWPNDAIMCKQNFPNMLEVVYPYYTSLQGVKSTTQS